MSNKMKYLGLDEINDSRFIKKFSKENGRLRQLEKEYSLEKDYKEKNKIKNKIELLKQGIEGESYVNYELERSSIPMLCLHDVRIKSKEMGKDEDMYSQSDFVVVTNKFICILEVKNLVGSIEVDNEGNFIRIKENKYYNESSREGMYSPLTQGKKHADSIRNLLSKSKILKGLPDFPIKNIAVMANPKNIINTENAPKEVKSNIYRCDQVISYLEKELIKDECPYILTDSKVKEVAEYIKKNDEPFIALNPEREAIIDELTELRKRVYKEKGIEAFNIFTNKTRDLIVDIKPKTIDELKKFYINSWVVEEIGEEILAIVNKKKTTKGLNLKQINLLSSKLEEYREKTAQLTGQSPLNIISNTELSRLVEIIPRNMEELFEIKGFSTGHKLKNYGKDILKIINEVIKL